MTEKAIVGIYELITQAHANIQKNYSDIDPVVSVNTQMRKKGVPADVMTIDCLKTGKRILLIFHDEQADVVSYQFCFKDKDPHDEFESIDLKQVTSQQLYDWMVFNFSKPN
jgi:hypothetical protein